MEGHVVPQIKSQLHAVVCNLPVLSQSGFISAIVGSEDKSVKDLVMDLPGVLLISDRRIHAYRLAGKAKVQMIFFSRGASSASAAAGGKKHHHCQQQHCQLN